MKISSSVTGAGRCEDRRDKKVVLIKSQVLMRLSNSKLYESGYLVYVFASDDCRNVG